MSPMNSDRTKRRATEGDESRRFSACSVLSFGYGTPEMARKHEALSQGGFDVTSVSDFEKVKNLIAGERDKYNILLIGRLVPQQEREMLSKLYRQCCPAGNVILFYRGSIANAHGATAVLSEQHSPANLLDAIEAIQRTRER